MRRFGKGSGVTAKTEKLCCTAISHPSVLERCETKAFLFSSQDLGVAKVAETHHHLVKEENARYFFSAFSIHVTKIHF